MLILDEPPPASIKPDRGDPEVIGIWKNRTTFSSLILRK
jgi:hypothetical protein